MGQDNAIYTGVNKLTLGVAFLLHARLEPPCAARRNDRRHGFFCRDRLRGPFRPLFTCA
jgi:hypothetical protein